MIIIIIIIISSSSSSTSSIIITDSHAAQAWKCRPLSEAVSRW